MLRQGTVMEDMPFNPDIIIFIRGICSWNFRLNYYTEKQ